MMNKRIKTFMGLLLVMAMLLLVGCSNTPATFKVTVTGGTGGGEFEVGKSATVTATVADDKQFVNWTVDGKEVSKANPYTFTVEKDVTVVANVENKAVTPVAKFTITVTGGTGGGEFETNANATLTATIPTGNEFVNWTVDGVEVSKVNPYTFKVEKDVTVVANFKAIEYTITVTGGTIGDGTLTSQKVAYGSDITVKATIPTDKQLSNWTVDGKEVSKANPYTFKVEKDVTVVANFKAIEYTVTVTGGTGGGEFEANVNATLTATVPTGNEFVNWTVDGVEVSTANPYIFAVTKDVTVVANFKAIEYTITVTGGTIGDGTLTTQKVAYGSDITVKATLAAEMQLTNWTVDGVEVSTANPYTFAVTKDVTVVANVEIKKYTITVKNGTTDVESGKYVKGAEARITAKTIEGYTFRYWKADGNKIEDSTAVYALTVANDVSLVAVYETKLAAPDNSDNKLMYGEDYFKEENPLATDGMFFNKGAVAINRGTNNMFATAAVDYIIVSLYESADSNAQVMGTFKLTRTHAETLDGSHQVKLSSGSAPDYRSYIEAGPMNDNAFLTLISKACGYNYSQKAAYYLAFQAVASDVEVEVDGIDTLSLDSDLSIKTPHGYFVRDINATAGKFDIKVIDGKIDGTLTTINAGYGVKFTLTSDAEVAPDGQYFVGWMEFNETTSEYVGGILFTTLTVDYTVTKAIVMKARFANDGEVIKLPLNAPENSNGQMLRIAGNGAYEMDRHGGGGATAFVEGVDYILYHVYDSNADDAVVIKTFKMFKGEDGVQNETSTKAYFTDDTITQNLKGAISDLYHDEDGGKTEIRKIAGITEAGTYYFAVQAIAKTGSEKYADSALSAKGPAFLVA